MVFPLPFFLIFSPFDSQLFLFYLPIRLDWVADVFCSLGKNFPEFGEDPFAKQYVILGLAKFETEMYHEARSAGKEVPLSDVVESRLSLNSDSKNQIQNPLIGPPPRSTSKFTSQERMTVMTTLIESTLNDETEVIEQVFALEAISCLAQIQHPHIKLLVKSQIIMNWINEKKELTREKFMRSERWRQKLRDLSNILPNPNSQTLQEAPLLGWAERIASNSQLFGLQDSLQISENELNDGKEDREPETNLNIKKSNEASDLMLNMSKIKDLFQRIRTR